MNQNDLPTVPAAALPPSLRARLLADAARVDDRLPKALAPGVVLGISASWLALLVFRVTRRYNWGSLPLSASWIVLGEIALAATLATMVALSRGPLMLGPSARRMLWSVSIPMLLVTAVAVFVPNTTPTPSQSFLRNTLSCDVGTLIVAVPLLVMLVLGQRARFVPAPSLLGAVAGVASATWAHALLHWACPWTDLQHTLFGHVAPVIPLATGGAILSQWIHRPRALRR
jgi:hypothetical protein